MALSPKTLRVCGALLLAFLFIAAGYYFSSPFKLSIAEATSTEEILKAYAAKDTDGDGLPDWKESLYGTDPKNPHSFDPQKTDGEAVALGLVQPKFKSTVSTSTPLGDADFQVDAPDKGSITEQFAKYFFESYMNSGAAQGGNSAAQDAVLKDAMSKFSAQVATNIRSMYTSASVRTSPDATLHSYAAAVTPIFLANSSDDVADPGTLIDAFISGESGTKARITTLALTYKNIALGLSKVSVPPDVAETHLSLLRSYDLLAQATTLIEKYDSDPLLTVGALSVYKPASDTINSALGTISTKILVSGEPAPGTPEAVIVASVRASLTP